MDEICFEEELLESEISLLYLYNELCDYQNVLPLFYPVNHSSYKSRTLLGAEILHDFRSYSLFHLANSYIYPSTSVSVWIPITPPRTELSVLSACAYLPQVLSYRSSLLSWPHLSSPWLLLGIPSSLPFRFMLFHSDIARSPR